MALVLLNAVQVMLRLKPFWIFCLFVVVFTFAGCLTSNAPQQNNSSDNNDNHYVTPTTNDLNLTPTTTSLALKTSSVLEPLRLKLLELQEQQFQSLHPGKESMSAQSLADSFDKIASTAPLKDIARFKVSLEQAIAPSKDILFNKNASTLVDVFQDQKLNAESGVYAFFSAILAQVADEKTFHKYHLVFIHEPGHILPGFLRRVNEKINIKGKTKINPKTVQRHWILHGIEMVASGAAIRNYGISTKLNGPMRVVDAFYELQILTSDDSAENKKAAETKALQLTAKHYSIPLSTLEDAVSKSGSAGNSNKPFAFGSVDIPDGDLKRKPLNAATNVYATLSGITPSAQVTPSPNSSVSTSIESLNISAKIDANTAFSDANKIIYEITPEQASFKTAVSFYKNALDLNITFNKDGYVYEINSGKNHIARDLSAESDFLTDFFKGNNLTELQTLQSGAPDETLRITQLSYKQEQLISLTYPNLDASKVGSGINALTDKIIAILNDIQNTSP